MLSIDPGRHPVEPFVVPIVYELFASGLAQPCWSCEGHEDGLGQLYKWPRVWFYTGSSTYLDLLRTTLRTLETTGRTHRPWTLDACDWQPHAAAVMYELGASQVGPEPTLNALQDDLRAVGQSMNAELRAHAQTWLATA